MRTSTPGWPLCEIDAVTITQEHVQVSVKIRRLRQFRFRSWLTMELLALAAWIAPFGFSVEQGFVEEGQEEFTPS